MYSTSQTAGTPERLTGQILEDGTPMTESMNRFSWGTVPYPERSGSAGNHNPLYLLTNQTGLQEHGKLGVVALAFNPSAPGAEGKAEAWRITVR